MTNHPNSPVREAAENDPRVQEAALRIEEATVELHQALADLSPRLGGAIAKAIGPDLCAQAVRQGCDSYARHA
jgi:hypothetical protein